MSNGPTIKMKKRLKYTVMTAIILAFLVLVGSLVNISVVKYDFYTDYANRHQLRPETIAASRGSIYDRNMEILAQSATVWDVIISPMDIKSQLKDQTKLEEKRRMIAKGLSDILGVDEEKIYQQTLKTTSQYAVVKTKVEKDVEQEVRTFIKDNKLTNEINLVENTKRYYPNTTLASSVLGFAGTDKGLYGLESKYDRELSGTPGYIVTLKDGLSENMPNSFEEKYDPINGNSLVLTLDETIQHFTEKALTRIMSEHNPVKGCCAIVMNVKTGEILAMADMPNFDCNQPFVINDPEVAAEIAAITDETEQAKARSAAQQEQWYNKSVSYTYQPGSTFKTLVASAALEEKVENLNSSFYCPGYVVVEDRTMKCHVGIPGHGTVNFTQSVVNSCNPAFVKIGQDLGAERFFRYFENFGLTEKTGIDLPGEGKSSFYTQKQLSASNVSLASCSFGQSMAVTPIQLITAVSAIANGGYLVKPHIVKEIIDDKGNVVTSYDTEVKRQVISQETSEMMCTVMEQVVIGKSTTNASVKGYRVGGKSGTSQKQNPGDSEDARIGSYVAIAPIEDPEIAVLVMIDEPTSGEIYGSVIAAPPVASILADTLPYLGYSPQYSAEEMQTLETRVPYLINRAVSEAESTLLAAGLSKPKVIGNGNVVIKQVPSTGSSIPKNGTVILYTADEAEKMQTVPNVIGLQPSTAKRRLTELGFNVIVSGAASGTESKLKITNQSIAEGTEAPIGTVIELTSVQVDTD